MDDETISKILAILSIVQFIVILLLCSFLLLDTGTVQQSQVDTQRLEKSADTVAESIADSRETIERSSAICTGVIDRIEHCQSILDGLSESDN